MKKIFTLALGLLFTAALFAADRRPSVTVNNSRNFEIVINGKSYFNNAGTFTLPRVGNGVLNVKVFETRRGILGRGRRLVDQTSFRVTNNDVIITVDRMGDIIVRESRMNIRNDRNNRRMETNIPRRF